MKSSRIRVFIFALLISESSSFLSLRRVFKSQTGHFYQNNNNKHIINPSFHSCISIKNHPIPEWRLRSFIPPLHSQVLNKSPSFKFRNGSRLQTIQALSRYSDDDDDEFPGSKMKEYNKIDPLVSQASKALRRSSWLSWWIQVILTTVSSITLIFAKTVLAAQSRYNGGSFNLNRSGFILAGSGMCLYVYANNDIIFN